MDIQETVSLQIMDSSRLPIAAKYILMNFLYLKA